MKNRSGLLGRIGLASTVVLLVVCLPVVPVLKAPVVPNAVSESTLVCVLQLVWSRFLVGIRLQATAATLPVLIVLVVFAVIAVRSLDRRCFGDVRRNNDDERKN